MPIPTIPLWGQVISNGFNNIRDIWKTAKERYNSMPHEQKAEAARAGDQWVRDNVLPVVTTVGELIPQTSIPMAAYNTSEAKTPEERFQHIIMPVMMGSVGKGTGLALKASEKGIGAVGKALKNIRKETKAVIPIEEPMAKTIFRANVYKGGEIADPYNSFFTTDPEYAAQYGPVKQYIIEGKNPSVAKEPLMGYRDPVTMDMFVYRNIDNPESTIIIGKDILEGAKLYADDAGTVSVLDAGYTQDQYIPSRQRQAVTDYLLKQSNWKDAKQISLKDLAEIDIPEYAEAKYPGLFELTKFPYALFPENTSKLNRDAIKFFQDKGVKIKLYTPTTRGKVGDFNEVLQELLEEHPDILFKQGGKIKSIFNPQQ